MATGGEFHFEGSRLVYEEYGEGPRALVLLPGLLLSKQMHAPLAEALAHRGNRVICLDLLGHGHSDRPADARCYSMPSFGRQTVGLLDHLALEQAVVGGTSLGANVTLEAAALAPERLRGMVVEMPVLDSALLACALIFTPLMAALTFGEPGARLVARTASRVPRGITHFGDTLLDWISQDPAPSAAVLQGLFFERVAPTPEARRQMEPKALVIGHARDPIHPFSDADELVRELPNGRLLRARSLLELRIRPERLTGEIASFLEECWRPIPTASTRRARRTASEATRSGARRRGARPKARRASA